MGCGGRLLLGHPRPPRLGGRRVCAAAPQLVLCETRRGLGSPPERPRGALSSPPSRCRCAGGRWGDVLCRGSNTTSRFGLCRLSVPSLCRLIAERGHLWVPECPGETSPTVWPWLLGGCMRWGPAGLALGGCRSADGDTWGRRFSPRHGLSCSGCFVWGGQRGRRWDRGMCVSQERVVGSQEHPWGYFW